MGVPHLSLWYYGHVGNKQYHFESSLKNKDMHKGTNDFVIRQALRSRLHEEYKSDPVYRVVDEMTLNQGSVRADMVVINGVMHAFEIKSDKDNLLRLPNQAEAYSDIFDKVTLVVGFAHICEALEIIPDWWGVEIAKFDLDGLVVFSRIREPQFNTSKDAVSVAGLLWKHEALSILDNHNAANGLKSKPRYVVHEKLAQTVDIDTLSYQVRSTLCARSNWLTA